MSFKITTLLKQWILGLCHYKKNKESNQIEYSEMTQLYKPKSRKMWTSKYGEKLVKYLIEESGLLKNDDVVEENVHMNGKIFDLKFGNILVEVKTRNWTTTGTAGEKILGVPYKYCNYIQDYELWIVVVGYQEKEADYWNIFSPTGNQKELLDTYKNMGIQYVRCSDLLFRVLYNNCIKELHISNQQFKG